MKKTLLLLILPLLLGGVTFVLLETPQAEGARLGGGRSFGGGPSFSRPVQPPRNDLFRQNQPAQGSLAGAQARSGGLLGGRGSFLGPLLAGSLLGALLLGGAFSGLGMADLLLVALLIFAASRLLRRRPSPAPAGAYSRSASGSDSAWDMLRGGPAASAGASAAKLSKTSGGLENDPENGASQLPSGFDQDKFLAGAKLMYARLQESWDKRDLEDIAEFTTPAMFKEIQSQSLEDPEPSRTEVLTLEASLCNFGLDQGRELVAVYFDALLREHAGQGAENAREVWTFTRAGAKGNWKLHGIQQAG